MHHAPGNNFKSAKVKSIWFRVTFASGDPSKIFYFPDDVELSKKKIIGIVANTGRDSFDWDHDIDGTWQPGFLPFGMIYSDMVQLVATFVKPNGDYFLENMPLNSLNSLKKRGIGAEIPGFVIPVNSEIGFRQSYVRTINPSLSSFDGYIVFTFYYND